MRTLPRLIALLALLALSSACWSSNEEPQGLRLAAQQGGPEVIFDLDERPFPAIPFPNNVATRIDPSSPTGLRLNVSEFGASQTEERVRRALNELTGFGVFSPITLSFDKPLDVENLIERHQELTPDFSNDAIYLVNVDPESPTFGSFELLDMGLGNFPITLQRPNNYYDFDPKGDGTNLLFPTAPHHGGIPNLRTPDGDPWQFREVLDFYERETNTLILRPVHALEPGTTYAVVLTSALTGEDGESVQSPFRWVNHLDQTAELEPLRKILPTQFPQRFNSTLEGVQFAWSFTTQVPTERLEVVRAGLYGEGPLAWLSDEFPAELHMVHNVKAPGADEPMTFDLEALLPILIPIANDELGPEGTAVIAEAFRAIDYVVGGTFLSPNFLGEEDGIYEESLVQIDVGTGTARVIPGEVPFICTVPKQVGSLAPPFPTIIYSHAIGSTRFEMLAFSGSMAKFGFATCAIDAAGHGVNIPSEFETVLRGLGVGQGLENLGDVLNHHRARDINNNGEVEPGADYFTADVLHSRDMILQTTIDQMQLVRILRTFDGTLRFPDEIDEESPFIAARRHLAAGWDQSGDGRPEIAGDFNGDGVVDFGGERAYVTWGTSLGGIQSTVLAAAEPTIIAGASNAGGGGLADIAARTTIGNVRAGVVLRMMGPLLLGRPLGEGRTRLEWLLPEGDSTRRVIFTELEGIEAGDRIVLRNLVREKNPLIPEEEVGGETLVTSNGSFRVGIAADAVEAPIRRQRLGIDASQDIFRDLMSCRTASRCGNRNCPDNNYCSSESQCRPLNECQGAFQLSQLSEEKRAEYERRIVSDPRVFGDPLVIEVYGADGDLKFQIDTFPEEIWDQNLIYPAGAPLAALSDGWGLSRQTPRFRQFIGLAQTLLEPADPAVWAPHFFLRPLEFDYEKEPFRRGTTNFLTIGTLGDQTVPISSHIAIARTAGVVETLMEDSRYGMPANQYLIERFVYEGISNLNRFPDYPNTIFDPDNLDEGKWRSPSAPELEDPKPAATHPVRAQVETPYGLSALRLGYLRRRGEHTFNAPDPSQPFDIHSFLTNQVGYYLSTGGKEISDDHCLEDLLMRDCPFYDIETFENPL